MTEQPEDPRVVVVTPEGMGVAEPDARGEEASTNPADLVEQPAKVMRIGSMIKNLLDEVRNAPLDEAGRSRLAEIHKRSIAELKDGLAPELVQELDRLALPFGEDAPSDAELRIAQAQLVGWLEGLFHGIQTALVAQQMAVQQQLAGMRRALPPGVAPEQPGMPGPGGRADRPDRPASTSDRPSGTSDGASGPEKPGPTGDRTAAAPRCDRPSNPSRAERHDHRGGGRSGRPRESQGQRTTAQTRTRERQ